MALFTSFQSRCSTLNSQRMLNCCDAVMVVLKRWEDGMRIANRQQNRVKYFPQNSAKTTTKDVGISRNNFSFKVVLNPSLIFVFVPTALSAHIAKTANWAIWAGKAVGSNTKIKETSLIALLACQAWLVCTGLEHPSQECNRWRHKACIPGPGVQLFPNAGSLAGGAAGTIFSLNLKC